MKIFKFSELHIFWFSLFHSIATYGKKEFWKKFCFTLNWGTLLAFLVFYGLTEVEMILNRYSGDWFLNIEKKQHSFLHHLLFSRVFKPSSWKSFSLDATLIAPVIANAELYWTDSIYWWNEAVYAWLYIISQVYYFTIIKMTSSKRWRLGKVLWNLRNRPIILLTLLYMFLRCSWKSNLTSKTYLNASESLTEWLQCYQNKMEDKPIFRVYKKI